MISSMGRGMTLSFIGFCIRSNVAQNEPYVRKVRMQVSAREILRVEKCCRQQLENSGRNWTGKVGTPSAGETKERTPIQWTKRAPRPRSMKQMKGDTPEFLEKVRRAARQVVRKTKKAIKDNGYVARGRILVCKHGDPAERRLDKLIAKLQKQYLAEIADPA